MFLISSSRLAATALVAAAATAGWATAPAWAGSASAPAAVNLEPQAEPTGSDKDKYADKQDLVDAVMGNGSFTTLLAAAEAAGLVDTLKGDGPYTLLAPTDEAFAKLPQGAIAELLMPENQDKLKSVLLYHVVDGKVSAEKAMGMSEFTTLEGSMVTVKTRGDKVMLNDATVLEADVKASNGMIHVIDTVLMPEE